MSIQSADPGFKPDLYVVVRMLEKLLQSRDQELKRTQLQMRSGLNWNVFTKYLDLLLSRELAAMETHRDGEYVVVTDQGRKAYRLLIKSIAEVLGDKWMEHGRRRL